MAVMKQVVRPFLWTIVVTLVYASAAVGLAALSGSTSTNAAMATKAE